MADTGIENRLAEIERRMSVLEEVLRQALKHLEGAGARAHALDTLLQRFQNRFDSFSSLLGNLREVLNDIRHLLEVRQSETRLLDRALAGIARIEDEFQRGNQLLEEEAAKFGKRAAIDGDGT